MAEDDRRARRIEEYEEAVREECERRRSRDFLFFADDLVIPSADGPQRFGDCMVPYQREAFESLAPSLSALMRGEEPERRRFWVERVKKGGKDSDLAVVLLWLMSYCEHPLKCQVVACDGEQAGIVADRAVEIVHYNPWLNGVVEIVQREIRGRGTRKRTVWTRIEASDMKGGAHGQTPDLLVLNELTHSSTVWRAIEDHMANADGVPRGVVIVSTNAGVKGTKAEMWKRNAVAHPERWKMLVWSKPVPWWRKEDIEDARRRDPMGAEFARLWEGRWISGVGGAVEDALIDDCFRKGLAELTGPEEGWQYVAAFDLGVSHDHSGVVVLGANRVEQRMRVAKMRAWRPDAETGGRMEVDLQAVEDFCHEVSNAFRLSWFGYDPAAGGSYMAQRLRRRGVAMQQMSFSTANKIVMANAFVQAVKDGKLECYEDEGLRRDFGKFSIVPYASGGYKLEAVSDEHGHADVGTALVICLPRAVEMLGGWGMLQPDDDVAGAPDAVDEDLTEEQVRDLPPELREIYDASVEEEVDVGGFGKGWNRVGE